MSQPRDTHDALQPHAVEPEPEEKADDAETGEDDQRVAHKPGADATDAARRHRPG